MGIAVVLHSAAVIQVPLRCYAPEHQSCAPTSNLVVGAGGWQAAEVSIAYGGVAPRSIMAVKTAATMQGRPLDQDTLQAALAAVAEDVNIAPNAPG